MPFGGGAIQLAVLPGSTQSFISDWTKARSFSLGSHSPTLAFHCASEIGWPS